MLWLSYSWNSTYSSKSDSYGYMCNQKATKMVDGIDLHY